MIAPIAAENVWTRFRSVASTRPDHPAVVCTSENWTFRQVAERAAAVAARLVAANVTAPQRVLLWADNSPQLAAALLGVFAVGGVAVFIPADAPPSHLNHAAKITSAALCLADAPRIDAKAPVSMRLLEEFASPSSADPGSYAGPDTPGLPASILFTSGSTGLPKGVVQPHSNLLIGCDTVSSYLRYKDADRIVCPIPWAFDYGYGQLLSTLCRGLTHILPAAANPFALCDAIASHSATVLPGLPSWFAYLFRGVSPIKSAKLSTIRLVTNTGGTIPAGVLDDMMIAFEHADIVLNYGLTETYRSTSLPPSLLKAHRNSIGRAIPGVDILIVREDGRIAGPGEEGEIVHRGNGVFLGYWGNTEATEKTLRADPLLPPEAPNAKALYTGDLGYKDDEGFVYFRGRRDHQLKSMGVRVSPGEVEAILHHTRLLRHVAVFGLPHEFIGDAVMCAFEPMPGEADVVTKLQTHARKGMSPYMQPREYFLFETLPKTPSGKIDYVAIRRICREKSNFVRPKG